MQKDLLRNCLRSGNPLRCTAKVRLGQNVEKRTHVDGLYEMMVKARALALLAIFLLAVARDGNEQ
jgi:hypothetical protein